MRLITRADFDGLVCAVLLKEVMPISSIELCHPKDVQDGKVKVSSDDIITNLPYNPDAGMWFDHHASEIFRNEEMTFKGRFAVAPSAARVVYDYYLQQGHGDKLKKYDELLKEVDKSDAALLSPEDVTAPKGWVLLAYLMDPRTGLGKQHDYQISNRELMNKMIEWIPTHTAEQILELPDIKPRVDRYLADENKFKEVLQQHSRQDGNVVITDLRGVETPAGNRFLIYTLFPNSNISVRVIDGKKGEFAVVAVGHSVFNRTSKTDVGDLMAKYGGGGHKGAGTCQLSYVDLDAKLTEMVALMKQNG
ncbi:MAG: exopolyphosphatase [Rhizobacter sp.]|nr:exopolyphosphatase [Chlorobiales bacterium]